MKLTILYHSPAEAHDSVRDLTLEEINIVLTRSIKQYRHAQAMYRFSPSKEMDHIVRDIRFLIKSMIYSIKCRYLPGRVVKCKEWAED